MVKSCKGLAMELVKCLSESDCVKIGSCFGDERCEFACLRLPGFDCMMFQCRNHIDAESIALEQKSTHDRSEKETILTYPVIYDHKDEYNHASYYDSLSALSEAVPRKYQANLIGSHDTNISQEPYGQSLITTSAFQRVLAE
ncbi:hypothetical protein MUK42_20613 [Musa troglodytarum]|uniref:Uncharacterized protein n=1 Tax=Musa troglodytarum TaxID=320322 RepID=A0A9E7EYV0_9LILI|nr:hypothetical protein MUK42_20613 [Musa troglodytarum]